MINARKDGVTKCLLKHWFLECGPWTSSSITWGLLRNACYPDDPRTNESRNSVGGTQESVFISPPGKSYCERNKLCSPAASDGERGSRGMSGNLRWPRDSVIQPGYMAPVEKQFLRGAIEYADKRKMCLLKILPWNKVIGWIYCKMLNYHCALA